MTREKKHTFRGKVVRSAHKQKEKGKGGYLNIPKGVSLLKLPEDERTFELDFLPYIVTSEKHMELDAKEGVAVKGSLWYRSQFKVHRNVGVDNKSVICPTTVGKKCPICEHRVKRIKDGADKEEFKLFYPQDRSLYVVIPVGHKNYEEEPYVWDMADFLFQEVLIDELEEKDENEDFFTLENGKTAQLKLKWKQIGKNTYPEVVSVNFIARDPYEDSILEELPKLDDMLQISSYEEISNMFFEIGVGEEEGGKLSEEEDEDEEDETPPARTPQRRKKHVESEEAPKRSLRRQKQEQVEEEEEEEVKEEKPVRSRSRKTEVKEDTEERCPHGHKFGVDTDNFKDCDTCEIWDDCIEEKERV